jgi:hypothetical protein
LKVLHKNVWSSRFGTKRERDRIEDAGKHMDVTKSLMRQISVCHIDGYEEWSKVLVNLKHTTLYQISGDSVLGAS